MYYDSINRYNLSGKKTHTDFYDSHGRKVGSAVERHSMWDGRYLRHDLYDSHGRKVGTAK